MLPVAISCGVVGRKPVQVVDGLADGAPHRRRRRAVRDLRRLAGDDRLASWIPEALSAVFDDTSVSEIFDGENLV